MKRFWMGLAMYPIIMGSALAAPQAADTSRQDPSPTSSVEPYPTLVQEKEAWAKVMQLISLHNGYVTSAEFEDTFNVKLKDIGVVTHQHHFQKQI